MPGCFERPAFYARAVWEVKKGAKTMITEIAQIEIKPGSEKDFEAAIAKAESIFKRCKGWISFELHKSIEKPSR